MRGDEEKFALEVIAGTHPKQRFLLPQGGEVTLGRNTGLITFPDDEALSDPHAVVAMDRGWVLLRPCVTTGGVYQRVTEAHLLQPGTLFTVGHHHLRYLGKMPERSGEGIFGAEISEPLFGVEEIFAGGVRGQRLLRPAPGIIIGRSRDDGASSGSSGGGFGCFVLSGDSAVSRRHALLSVESGGTFLRDLGSASGTFVRLVPEREVVLEPGDEIRLGSQYLRLIRP